MTDKMALGVVDMTALYERFLPLVPDGGSSLDGGSGQDALAFKKQGYKVVAFDASETLCKLASEYLNQTVGWVRLNEMAFQKAFDAV